MEHSFINNRDIVLFSFQPWDTEIGSNFKDMAYELSKINRVLYVNRALDRASIWKNKTAGLETMQPGLESRFDEIKEVNPHLWVQNPGTILESINWIPWNWLYDVLNKINNKRLANHINKAIKQLGFSNVILINDNDFIRGRYLKQLVNCTDYIFYLRDYLLGVGYFKRHGPRLESGMLKEVSLVVANSAYLANYAKKVNPKSFDIGQGCDLENYLTPVSTIPNDLQNIKKPIIGYSGYISAWRIDVGIIKYVAEQFPGCSTVLVGPLDELFQKEELKGLPNIHFLGRKPPSELAGYISHFDVCINPQVLNEITRGNYPRKIDEYLAMGKPVVATKTEAMELFEPYTYLCSDKTEYVKKINHILHNPHQSMSEQEVERRRSFALTHSWKNSIGRLGDAYYFVKNSMSE